MSLRATKKQRTHDSILAVCRDLFRTRGFDETTITDIVAAVGISRQTFFNYFPGKDAVLAQLGLEWLRQQAAVPRIDPGTYRGGSILAGTREAVRAQLRAIQADPEFMRLIFTRSNLLFPHGSSADVIERSVHRDHTRAIFEAIAAVIKAAQDSGEVRRDIPALQVAELYVSTMLMTTRLWLVDYWHDGIDLETRGMRALDVLEAGLANQPTNAASDGADQDADLT